MVDIISPGNSFKDGLKKLLAEKHRLLTLKDMGFPLEWETLPVLESDFICKAYTGLLKRDNSG